MSRRKTRKQKERNRIRQLKEIPPIISSNDMAGFPTESRENPVATSQKPRLINYLRKDLKSTLFMTALLLSLLIFLKLTQEQWIKLLP